MKAMFRALGCGLAAAVLWSAEAGAEGTAAMNKPATSHTMDANAAVAAGLPVDDQRDLDFAGRGFIATMDDPQVKTADGKLVWDFAAYDFLKGPAPATVNPSLWRQAGILARHGLFKVADHIYQVRGFDISNITHRGQDRLDRDRSPGLDRNGPGRPRSRHQTSGRQAHPCGDLYP